MGLKPCLSLLLIDKRSGAAPEKIWGGNPLIEIELVYLFPGTCRMFEYVWCQESCYTRDSLQTLDHLNYINQDVSDRWLVLFSVQLVPSAVLTHSHVSPWV